MPNDTSRAVTEVMEAFTEFKNSNDKLLSAKADGKAVGDLTAKVEKISDHLDKFERLNQSMTLTQQNTRAMQEQIDHLETVLNRPTIGGGGARDSLTEVQAAFNRAMRRPASDRDAKDVEIVKRHMNALIKGDDTGAGYLLAPPDMQKEIIKGLIEMSPMRAIATVRTIGGPSFKRPKRTSTGGATRVGELGTRTNTGDPKYGMIEILAPELFARVEVSMHMLEDADYDLGAELRQEATEQFAVKEGAESLTGTGTGTNQSEGILTNADVTSINSGSAAAITADGIVSLFHEVKTGYARNGVFAFNRYSLRDIRKLKDGQSQYLWVPGITNGQVNTLMGAPYVEMADMPNAAADTFPVMFGDFRRAYCVVDRFGISFQSDFITGADDGIVVFRARKRTGGGVMLAEAVKKLKCAV